MTDTVTRTTSKTSRAIVGESESATMSTQEQDAEKTLLHNQNTESSTGTGAADVADPFTNEEGAEIKYKTMEWWHVGLLMLAETVSLGVLSLPFAIATLGVVPALLLICVLSLVSTYNGYVIGQFKLAFPAVYSMGDAGKLLAGRFGQMVGEGGMILVLVFVMAAHLTAFTIMMNVLTGHPTCSVLLSLIGLVVSFLLSMPRKLEKVAWLSVVSCVSVASAVLITLIDVSIMNPGIGDLKMFHTPSLAAAMTAALNIILSYAGHVAYFGFIAELREPRDFKKALFLMQGLITPFYIVSAILIYYYCGPNVPAPAISAAQPVVAKIAYGIASPTIVIAGVVNGHVAFKAIYLRVCSKETIHQTNFRALGSWYGICAATWLTAWLIAESIPAFHQLLALVSALFTGWFSYGFSGLFWLHMNKGKYSSTWNKIALTCLNVIIVVTGAVICGFGLYASGKELHDGKGGRVFTCEDTAPQL